MLIEALGAFAQRDLFCSNRDSGSHRLNNFDRYRQFGTKSTQIKMTLIPMDEMVAPPGLEPGTRPL